ncbi:ankyrin repeat and SOCS box protein 17 isoform 2-T2 [Sarcophilus harrisii]
MDGSGITRPSLGTSLVSYWPGRAGAGSSQSWAPVPNIPSDPLVGSGHLQPHLHVEDQNLLCSQRRRRVAAQGSSSRSRSEVDLDPRPLPLRLTLYLSPPGTFTPVYCPSPLSGITPLLYVAQTRQSNILKILLQYGILERERKPVNIVLTILLYPSRVRIMVDHELVDIREDAKTCLVLCSRVLSVIPVREIEAQLSLGRRPIVSNWLDYIPSTRYKDPCELLHLCRLTIRAQLLSNNMLPNGIFSLLIPVRLQNYLNLES